MSAYYNECDPYAAQWLRNLITAGLIAPGDVDERSIEDVRSEDLSGYTQCHFFAGIGGWSCAFRLAGWPDTKPVWSGSCPCQPFSVANVAHGGAKGHEDSRHLLPAFTGLIGESKPPVIFGEQVANAIKWGWLDECFAALESHNYSCGAAVIPASSIGASHERKRVFFVADTSSERRQGYQQIQRIPLSARETFTIDRNSLADARRALGGDYTHLLPHDGVSIAVERSRTKGYGNAIVPQVAAEFIRAYMECKQ